MKLRLNSSYLRNAGSSEVLLFWYLSMTLAILLLRRGCLSSGVCVTAFWMIAMTCLILGFKLIYLNYDERGSTIGVSVGIATVA